MGTVAISQAKGSPVRLDARFLTGAGGAGLAGGAVMAVTMMVDSAARGMGSTSMFGSCFASFIWPVKSMAMTGSATKRVHAVMKTGTTVMKTGTTVMKTGTTVMKTGTTMKHHHAVAMAVSHTATSSVPTSHEVVGALLHFGLSAGLGIAILGMVMLAARFGMRVLATPAGIVGVSIAAGAVAYGIVARGIAPAINSSFGAGISQPVFFLAHLFFGATVGILGVRVLRRATRGSLVPRFGSGDPRTGGT